MLHDLFDWMQNKWGVEQTEYGRSFSQALLESLNAWGLLEGTHLLTLMLFFGTILIVDLRLLGVAFKTLPVSTVSNRVLPLTVFAMVIVVITGVALFFSKPEEYWHNLWFRAKLVLLAVAIANVVIFHKLVQKNQAEWDTAEKPPAKARLSAIVSIASWVCVIAFGRFIAYNWYECGKPQPDWVNTAQACATSNRGAMSLSDAVEMGGAADPGAPAPSAPNDVFGPAPSAPNDVFGPPPPAPADAPKTAAQPEAK